MKRLGALIWSPGPSVTLKRSQVCTTRVGASLWSLTRRRRYQISYGKPLRAPLLMLRPRYYGVYSEIRLATPEGSVNAFLANGTPRNGGRSRSIVVKSRLPIRTRSTRGSAPMVRTPTSLEYVFDAASLALA